MPTGIGALTAAFVAACVAVARLFGIFELYLIAVAAAALLVGCVLFVLANRRSVTGLRTVSPDRVHVDGTAIVAVRFSSRRWLPSPIVHVQDHVDGAIAADAQLAPLWSGRPVQASYRVRTERRGLTPIGPLKVQVLDPFGLAKSSHRGAPNTSILVLPRIDLIAAPPQPPGRTALLADLAPTRIAPNGDEFSSLRAYVTGDDLRKVHWPSTARLAELVVRTDSISEHGRTIIVLDTREGVDADRFEQMVSAAASIAWAAHRRGDHTVVVSTSGERTDNSDGTCDRIFDQLALVGPAGPGRPFGLPFDIDADAVSVLVVTGTMDRPLVDLLSGRSQSAIVNFGGDTPVAQAFRPTGDAESGFVDVGSRDDFAATWEAFAGPAPLAMVQP